MLRVRRRRRARLYSFLILSYLTNSYNAISIARYDGHLRGSVEALHSSGVWAEGRDCGEEREKE